MAIKPKSQQPAVQAQADRPTVLGPLVAGVVVIKVFAAIKGESAVGMPEFDYQLTEEADTEGRRSGNDGLSIPAANDPAAGASSGLEPMSYAQPLAYQSEEAATADEAWYGEDPLKSALSRPQGRTADSDFPIADGPSARPPALDAPLGARAAGEQAGVAATGGDPLPGAASSPADGDAAVGGGDTAPGEDTGQDGPAEDAPTPSVFNTPPEAGDNAPGDDTAREDTPGDGPLQPVVFGDDPAAGPTGSWGGDPLLEDGGDDDILAGGTGDDIIRGLGGDDDLDGGGGDDDLYGGSEDDRLLGGNGDDRLDGDTGDDQLRGGAGDDSLDGGAGADRLFGLDGDDRLIGGLGRDELSGEQGADRFVLKDIAESDAQDPDRLLDFRAYERDKIDVSGIDANSQTLQDEAFAFIENDLFSGSAGELRFTDSHGATYLYGDVNGDGEADFGLELLGVSSLSVDDIIL